MVPLLQKKWVNKTSCLTLYLVLGTFFQCSYAQIASQKDCPTAMRICDATQSYFFEVTANNIGLIDDAYGLSQIYCQASSFTPYWEYTPAWFVFTPQYSGEFGFLICPEVTTTNWDWALFENPVCTDLNNTAYHLACSTAIPIAIADGCQGIGFKNVFGGGANGMLAYINITAGNTYVLYTYARTFVSDPATILHRATLSFQGAVVTAHPDLFNIPGCTMSAEDFVKDNTKVFPNPFTNSLQIESETSFSIMQLYDVAGKQIISQNFTNTIDTTNLAQGLYLLHLITEDGEVVVKKVIKG
jgi:hypothetical protein